MNRDDVLTDPKKLVFKLNDSPKIVHHSTKITSPQYLNVLNQGLRKMKGICCFCVYKHNTRLK